MRGESTVKIVIVNWQTLTVENGGDRFIFITIVADEVEYLTCADSYNLLEFQHLPAARSANSICVSCNYYRQGEIYKCIITIYQYTQFLLLIKYFWPLNTDCYWLDEDHEFST